MARRLTGSQFGDTPHSLVFGLRSIIKWSVTGTAQISQFGSTPSRDVPNVLNADLGLLSNQRFRDGSRQEEDRSEDGDQRNGKD